MMKQAGSEYYVKRIIFKWQAESICDNHTILTRALSDQGIRNIYPHNPSEMFPPIISKGTVACPDI
jgi:hypothetical protein